MPTHIETNSARDVIDSFKADFAATKIEHAELIAQFKAIVPAEGEALLSFHGDLIDELKGHLGANAANQEADEETQDTAISDCEEWVSSELSGKLDESVALCVCMYGPREGSERLYALSGPTSVLRLT